MTHLEEVHPWRLRPGGARISDERERLLPILQQLGSQATSVVLTTFGSGEEGSQSFVVGKPVSEEQLEQIRRWYLRAHAPPTSWREFGAAIFIEDDALKVVPGRGAAYVLPIVFPGSHAIGLVVVVGASGPPPQPGSLAEALARLAVARAASFLVGRSNLPETASVDPEAPAGTVFGWWRARLDTGTIELSDDMRGIGGDHVPTPDYLLEVVGRMDKDERSALIDRIVEGILTASPWSADVQLRLSGMDALHRVKLVGQLIACGPAKTPALFGYAVAAEEPLAKATVMQRAMDALDEMVWVLDADGRIQYTNGKLTNAVGSVRRHIRLRDLIGKIHPDDRDQILARLRTDEDPIAARFRVISADGSVRWLQGRRTAILNEAGVREGWVVIAAEMSRSTVLPDVSSGSAPVSSKSSMHELTWQLSREILAVADLSGYFVDVNPTLVRLLGYPREELLRRPRIEFFDPDDVGRVLEQRQVNLTNREMRHFEARMVTASGRKRLCAFSATTHGDLIYINGRDITEEREAEAILRQALKMEAIGHLTGGVAHDFNNLLTVVMGNAEELVAAAKDPIFLAQAQMILEAAEQGAELTQRLLAFARRQPLEPTVVALNHLLQDIAPLLERTIGEQVELRFDLAQDVWNTQLDASQLHSAILNLCINARDAMSDGGRIVIETHNVTLDEGYAERNFEVSAGDYALIAVSDTGAGMPPEVVARAFDPFFTTKPVGEGTGLGLSMVFGFIKQSGGHVKIYSEVGQGTSVKLYLPRAEASPVPKSETQGQAIIGGHETILVVEDDELVRKHVGGMLEALGYAVLSATNGPDALRIIESPQHIDLLFTDVVMPNGMNGRQLADQARKTRPDLRVLYTSGYTQNAIVHHGRLDAGVELLSKPYQRRTLANRVRKLLDE